MTRSSWLLWNKNKCQFCSSRIFSLRFTILVMQRTYGATATLLEHWAGLMKLLKHWISLNVTFSMFLRKDMEVQTNNWHNICTRNTAFNILDVQNDILIVETKMNTRITDVRTMLRFMFNICPVLILISEPDYTDPAKAVVATCDNITEFLQVHATYQNVSNFRLSVTRRSLYTARWTVLVSTQLKLNLTHHKYNSLSLSK